MEKIGVIGDYKGNIFGGKCDNLNLLKINGFNVPNGFCINNISINEEIIIEYLKKYVGTEKYIIRSSAFGEDGENISYAGFFKSITGFLSDGKIHNNIREVFNSINNDFLDIYEKKVLGKINYDRKMNVLIQEYIVGDYSGIYFGNVDFKKIFSFIKGGNSLLVDGTVDGTNIYMDNKFNIVKEEYNIQESFLDENLVIKKFNDKVYLENKIFLLLVKEFKKIEKIFGSKIDVEWTIANNKIYILQLRPITT